MNYRVEWTTEAENEEPLQSTQADVFRFIAHCDGQFAFKSRAFIADSSSHSLIDIMMSPVSHAHFHL